MSEATQQRGITKVSYTLAEDGFHQIGWSWLGDQRQYGMESRDLKALIQAALIAVAGYNDEEIAIYRRALHSIRRAACCEACNESGREAGAALDKAAGRQRGASDRLSA